MATDERFDESISTWLEQTAPTRLPERVLEATFERTRRSRQHVGWRALLGKVHATRPVFALGGAAVVVMAALALNFYVNRPSIGGPVFQGTWVSMTDADGGTQTMTVRVSADGTVGIVASDDLASVCSGGPSTMTGTGRIEGSTQLVIPSPVYTCDDGSEPEALSGPPLQDQLRNLTFVLDPEAETLTDNFGSVWRRTLPEPPSPSVGVMWPQTNMEEVRQAQELADAGDLRYTWQVDPELVSDANLYPWDAEIVERFLREELGWEEFGIGRSGVFAGAPGGPYDEVMLIRCAPGRTNPLYPVMPSDVRGCAPTIDDFRYETVRIDVEQPGLRGPSGIWVVTGWEMLQPVEPRSFYEHLYPHFELRQVEQVAPPSDAEVTALLQAFLGARVDGEGAERYVHRHLDGWDDEEVPILNATTGGSPYERYEFDRLQGPVWPSGWIEFRIRLFAEDGTVVEQSFIVVRQEDGRLGLMYGLPFETDFFPTTENGQPVPVPYRFLDGRVTFAVAAPWNEGGGDGPTFMTFALDRSSMWIVADPLPIETGCAPGLAAADAEALARSIRSNPDLEVTAPVTVDVGGVDALQIDVAVARGAGCDEFDGGATVVEDVYLAAGQRIRLYLLDLPGGPARTVAIVIAASEPNFEHLVEAAAPILDSFEFPAP